MKRTRLDNWICEVESLPELTREGLEALQLRRLNETLGRLKERGGIYAEYPERLDNLAQLAKLPFTTPAMLAKSPGSFLLASQSEVSRVISGATSGIPRHGPHVHGKAVCGRKSGCEMTRIRRLLNQEESDHDRINSGNAGRSGFYGR